MAESTNLTGLWPKGNRGTLWAVSLKAPDVDKVIRTLEQYRATGCDLSLWQNQVEAGSKKPAMSLKVGPPWVPNQNRNQEPVRQPAPGGETDDDSGIPF